MQIKQIISVIMLSTLCQVAIALPQDKEQTIDVRADAAEKDEKTGMTILTGNVKIRQGSILINAEKSTIHYMGTQISKIMCYGSPAYFQQEVGAAAGLVIGRAEIIQYNESSSKLILTKNASVVKADGSTITSDTINYNLTSESLNAGGGVHLVIPPNKTTGE